MPTHRTRLFMLSCLLWLYSLTALAAGQVLHVATRPGVQHSLLWWPAPAANATVLLFPAATAALAGCAMACRMATTSWYVPRRCW